MPLCNHLEWTQRRISNEVRLHYMRRIDHRQPLVRNSRLSRPFGLPECFGSPSTVAEVAVEDLDLHHLAGGGPGQ
jgi:hypothetical protein